MVKLSSLSLVTVIEAGSWIDHFHGDVAFEEQTAGNFTSYKLKLKLPEWTRLDITQFNIPATGMISEEVIYPSQPSNRGGVIGVALDGKPIWSSLYQHHEGSGHCDAGLLSSPMADMCHCLMGAGYIKAPLCLGKEQLSDSECVKEITVGVALDGFPIKIGSYDFDASNEVGELDECGGAFDQNGDYAYYFTDEWPYSLRCFRGTPLVFVEENPSLLQLSLENQQCPDIHEVINDVNGLIREIKTDYKPGNETEARKQRARSSPKNQDQDLVDQAVDFISSLSATARKQDADKFFEKTFKDFFGKKERKRRGYDELFSKTVKPRVDQTDYMGYLPYGVFRIDSLKQCKDGSGCLTPCDNSNYHDCDPDKDECLGFYGLYKKAVVCPTIDFDGVIPLEASKFHYKASDMMMAQRKGRQGSYKETQLPDELNTNFSYQMDDNGTDCFCRDFAGYEIGGTRKTITDFDRKNVELAYELGCLLCPANLIQTEKAVQYYETCEQPGNPIYPSQLLYEEGAWNLEDNYPLESRCTCPPGTIWSFAQMWCVPREHCLPAEIGVPVSCSAKSHLYVSAGFPPLECTLTDPDDPMPDHYCLELKNGTLACTEDLDEFSNIKNGAHFFFNEDYNPEEENKKEIYTLADDEWCTEWYDHSSISKRVNYAESLVYADHHEYFDEYFFEMIECDPIKMIIANSNSSQVYDGLDSVVFGKIDQSMYFYPRQYPGDWPYASVACYSTTGINSGGYECADLKMKFICKDPPQEDHYGDNYDDHYQVVDYPQVVDYNDYSSGDYGSYELNQNRPSTDYYMSSSQIYYSTTNAPVTSALTMWEKVEAAKEVRNEYYWMILENYGCTLLWFEYFQAKLYKSDNLFDGCVESIDAVYDVCLRRWENEDWAQTFDYNVHVDGLVMVEKEFFCKGNKSILDHLETPHADKENPGRSDYYHALESYKQELRQNFDIPELLAVYASCFEPLSEIMVDEERYSREICHRSHKVHLCVRDQVTYYIEDHFEDFSTSDYYYYGQCEGREMMDLLAEFSPGCDAHFPGIEVVNKCTAVQLANKVLECEKNYLFPHMPLHDDTPEVMLRYGVCVYVSVENCGQETINEFELDQRIGKIVDDIKKEVPPFAFTVVNLLRQRLPTNLEQAIKFTQWVASQFIEGIDEKVAIFEKLIGFSCYELIDRVLTYVESSYCAEPESRPLLSMINVNFRGQYDSMNADSSAQVCATFKDWENQFFDTMDKCSKKFDKFLTCHISTTDFVISLWAEIKQNIENFIAEHKKSPFLDEETSKKLDELSYWLPMVDHFLTNEMADFMKPIPAVFISLLREAKQLFVAYIDQIQVSQYACHPTPGQWSQWTGTECTKQCHRKTITKISSREIFKFVFVTKESSFFFVP